MSRRITLTDFNYIRLEQLYPGLDINTQIRRALDLLIWMKQQEEAGFVFIKVTTISPIIPVVTK